MHDRKPRFEPEFCPEPGCPRHLEPGPRFYRRHGAYAARCRTEAIPRFQCRACGKTFSRQTFRHDRYDRRPDANVPLFKLLISGVGLRQAGRILELDIHAVRRKLRKIGRTCGQLHRHLCRRLSENRTFLLDEEETYETASIRPVTMPVCIERETWFVVATDVGAIRRLAKRGSERRRRQEADEARFGRRKDESRECVMRTLSQLAEIVPTGPVTLQTDEKASYATVSRKIFGDRLHHETTAGRLDRGTHNALFPINTTLAMTRDNNGRLRRRSWLVSKRRQWLHVQMQVFTVYRNYVRRRFNRDQREDTPGRLLGLLPRALRPAEVLSWAQSWGLRSPHPMSLAGQRAVGEELPVRA